MVEAKPSIIKRVFGQRYNWLGLVFAFGLVMFCLLGVLPAALSGNPWFSTGYIDKEPDEIHVYYKGKSETFMPGDPEYDRIVSVAYEVIRSENGVDEVGLSDGRLEQARSEGIGVEMLYKEPVKLPGRRIDIADPTRIFIILEAFGYKGEFIWRGGRSEYWGLPIRVPTLDPLRRVVEDIMA
jgi:hypothetical protein